MKIDSRKWIVVGLAAVSLGVPTAARAQQPLPRISGNLPQASRYRALGEVTAVHATSVTIKPVQGAHLRDTGNAGHVVKFGPGTTLEIATTSQTGIGIPGDYSTGTESYSMTLQQLRAGDRLIAVGTFDAATRTLYAVNIIVTTSQVAHR